MLGIAIVHFMVWGAIPLALAWLAIGGDLKLWVLGFALVVVLYEGARSSANTEYHKARGNIIEKL